METSEIEMKMMVVVISRVFSYITPSLHHSIIPFPA